MLIEILVVLFFILLNALLAMAELAIFRLKQSGFTQG
jgi:CBS domain containing-hemolysin-like protein